MLGAVVGTHAGPGAVGLFWYDDEPNTLSGSACSEMVRPCRPGLVHVDRDGSVVVLALRRWSRAAPVGAAGSDAGAGGRRRRQDARGLSLPTGSFRGCA